MPETRSGQLGPDHQLTRRKKSPAKLILGIGVVAVVAVAAGWGLTHMNPPAGQGGAPGAGGPGGARRGGAGGGAGGRFGGRAAITVGTAPATVGNIPITLDALGTVTPPVTATIASRIAGNLMAVYFKEGQMVKKGQKLALIDPRPYQVALEQVEGTMARDQAALADARLDLQRYTTLLAQNSIAKQQVDTQAALVKQDEGVVKTDKGAVDNAKLNLAYTSITAPADGRVGLRLVDVGNYIPVGSTTGLVVLTQVNPIDVVFTIPEDNVPAITRRQRMGATLPVSVFDRGGGQILSNGTLSTLDNQIDTSTGTVKAKARFDNGDSSLFPNQFVNARLLVDNLCNAVIVPTTAVRHGTQGDFVYTLQPDRTAKMVLIKTGPGTGETVSIASGLTGSETVITEGGDRLRDGAKVNLPGDRPQGGLSGGRRRRGGAGAAGGPGVPGGAPAAAAAAQGGDQGQPPPGGGFQARNGGRAAGGGQSGQGGAGRFRRGQGGASALNSSPNAEGQIDRGDGTGLRSRGIPATATPPGACPVPGKGGGRFGHGPNPTMGSAAGGQDAQGGQGRRFHGGQGRGQPSQDGQGNQDQAAGQGRRHRQGQGQQANPGQAG
jgi:multidrug efflux system membrane fusion protein